jgi:UDP-glucose 4-epimerase
MSEQYLRWYAEQRYVRGVVLRLANVYGPGPRSSKADRGILNQMMRRALNGEALTVFGTGEFVRDYVYVTDVAHAFLAGAQHADALNARYFVIGSGRGHSIAEAMHMISDRAFARTGRRAEVRHVDPPQSLSPIEQRHFVADSSQFCRATGWHPRYALADGIDATMESFE